MPFSPEIYLIGAQKSGTTTLAYLLSQHPNISVCEPKESHFFSTNWGKDFDWYQDKFSVDNNQNTVCIDASTTYSMAPLSERRDFSDSRKLLQGVPQRIYSANPNAKFIYLLRDPIERAYSGYWHHFTGGSERRKFGEAIRDKSFYFNVSNYLDVSNYYEQLKLWLDYFSVDSFLFLLFEDMKKNPEKMAQDCFRFIGLEDVQTHLEEVRNKSRYVNSVGRRFNGWFRTLDNSGLSYVAPSCFRKFVRQQTTDHTISRPKMQEKDRTFLREYFSENKRDLELLTGLSLSRWQV